MSFCELVFAFIEYDYYLCDAQLLIHIIFLDMKRCTILLFVLSTLFTCAGAESPSSVSALLTVIDAAAGEFP